MHTIQVGFNVIRKNYTKYLDRTVYHSMFNLDCNAPKGVAQYEFWRQKAWHCKEILEDYATNQIFTKDSKALVAKVCILV